MLYNKMCPELMVFYIYRSNLQQVKSAVFTYGLHGKNTDVIFIGPWKYPLHTVVLFPGSPLVEVRAWERGYIYTLYSAEVMKID